MESKDRETSDIKHDLIAAQIQIDKLKQEIEQLPGGTGPDSSGKRRGISRRDSSGIEEFGDVDRTSPFPLFRR